MIHLKPCLLPTGILFPLVLPLLAPAALNADVLELDEGIHEHETIADTVVHLGGKVELHITTREGDPISESEIHLNSEDAWLFFTHIQPATVNSSFLGRIRVDGEPAATGQNVRVVQHELGTVVIPHGPDYVALRVFREPHFEGAQRDYHPNEFHEGLGGGRNPWANSISSFVLKRGYMATFAENSDGTGVSRVYIAQDGDLEVGVLTEDLDNSIDFLRVLPWRWVSKKGYAGGTEEPGAEPDRVNAAWFYNWNNDRNSSLNMEYVPIQHTAVWPGIQGTADKSNVTHYMGYNEPDSPDQDASQFTPTPQSAVDHWPNLMRAGYRLGSPSMTDGGLNWLYEFIDLADEEGLRVDYVVVHFYRWNYSANQLRDWLQGIHERTGGRPLWIKEFNNGANWTAGPPTFEQNAQRIGEFIQMMDETPWIERYSIYSWVEEERQVFVGGNFTPMGEVYRDQESPIGYVQEFPGSDSPGARYTFDGDTRDSTEAGNHAMTIGAPAFEPGVIGDSLRFDGERDYLQVPASVGDSANFTFAAWVKWDGGGNWQRIFDFGDAHTSYMFLTPQAGSGNLQFAIRSGGGTQRLEADQALPVGEWAHVAVTLPPRGGRFGDIARMYVNGEQVASEDLTLRPDELSTRYHYIGRSQAQYPDPFFAGQLDDVRIFDRALSQQEIAQLALPPGEGLSFSDWASEFDLPEGRSGPLDDASGNGIPNGLAFLLGADPLDPSSGCLPPVEFVAGSELGEAADDDKTYLSMQVRVRKNAQGVVLNPRAAASLDGLSDPAAAEGVRQALPPVDDGDFEIRTYFYDVPVEDSPEGKAFMRLHLGSES